MLSPRRKRTVNTNLILMKRQRNMLYLVTCACNVNTWKVEAEGRKFEDT